MTRLIPAILTSLAIAFTLSPLLAQDTTPAKEDEAAGRLPPYFRDIVNEEQREQIYEIQMKFDELVKPLAEKITALKTEESKEIEGVLTAKQRAVLAKVKDYYKAEALRRKQFLESLTELADEVKTP